MIIIKGVRDPAGKKWPLHPDGSPKKMGEMTPEERKQVIEEACQRLEAEFERNGPAIAKILDDFKKE